MPVLKAASRSFTAGLITLTMIATMALLSGKPAHAGESYEVVGVAPDDVLNIREAPSPAAAKIGALPFDGSGIGATGRTKLIGTETWREVTYGEITGWVNSRYLSATPGGGNPLGLQEPLSCSGTEPFWGLKTDGRTAEFDSLGEGKRAITFTDAYPAQNVPVIWALRGRTVENQSSVYAIIERTNQCSDGMSDLVYKYSIRLDIEGTAFYAGCCNAFDGQPAP